MVRYEVLTNKTYEEIEKFFKDALAEKKGVSFKCGLEYYNVIRFDEKYILSKLTLTKGGYVKDATSITTITGEIEDVCKHIYGIASAS